MIRDYLSRGYAVMPIPKGTKASHTPEWQKKTFGEKDFRKSDNVAVILGQRSGGLVDVDLDCDEAIRAADHFLPTTSMESGRRSAPRSHRWYRCVGPVDYKKHSQPKRPGEPEECLVEFRGDGHYTVVPPSIHPSGEAYEWHSFEEPALVDAEQLRNATAQLAAAALLARHWANGSRHDISLALAGALLRSWNGDVSRVQHFLEGCCLAACDEELRSRLKDVESTAKALLEGKDRVTGWPRLAELVGEQVVKLVRDWLGIRDQVKSPAKPVLGIAPLPEFRPFPIDVIPEPWKSLCLEGARILNVDVVAIVLPCVAMIGSAIGMTRVIRLNHDWYEPAVIWSCLVADSGTRKSGAAELSVDLAMNLQLKFSQQFKADLEVYRCEMARYKAEKKENPGAEQPEPPVHRRIVVSDTTLEKVISILDENSRGLLLYRDELRGWFGSFAKYRQAAAGSDEPAWLSMYGAKTLVYDRKTGTKTTVIVPNAAVSVTGTIQMKTLRRVLTEESFGSGLAARVIMAAPPKHPKIFVEEGIPLEIRQQCECSLAKLFDLEGHTDEDGIVRPRAIPLSPEARQRWKQFVNEFGERQYWSSGDDAAAMSKLEGIAGRFALIHHLVEADVLDDLLPVSLRSIEAGIKFVEWALPETIRVYRLIQEKREDSQIRELDDLVRRLADRLGHDVAPWELSSRHKTKYPTVTAAELALETLVAAGLGEWIMPERTTVGPTPKPRYRPFPPNYEYEKYEKSPNSGGDGEEPTTRSDYEKSKPEDSTPNRQNDANPVKSGECGTEPKQQLGDSSYFSYSSYSVVSAQRDIEPGEPEGDSSYSPSEFLVVVNADQLAEVGELLEVGQAVGLDLETTGLDPRTDRIRLLSLAVGDRIFLVDCFQIDPTPLFAKLADVELVGHNLVFDLSFLMHRGFHPKKAYCTMLASQVLEAGMTAKHTLKEVVKRHMGQDLDKSQQKANWAGELSADQLAYAAEDVRLLLPLRRILASKLQEAKLAAVVELENRALLAIASMCLAGVGFDAETWSKLADQAEADRERLRSELEALVPGQDHLFGTEGRNWDSPAAVRNVFEKLGLKLASTSDEALAEVDHPLAALLRRYRAASKRTTTYGKDWLRHVDGDRVFPSWKQCSTATGRMSCSDPNLQQLPRGIDYRRCFVASPGKVLIKADYSQIELRLAAKIADEPTMLKAYQRGDDLHTQTAKAVLGVENVSKADRQLAKAVNFGLLYGMGAKMFAVYAKSNYGVTLTEAEAKTYRQKFFKTYPALQKWHTRQAGATRDKAITTRTELGRRRLNVSKFTQKLNSPVQGSGADGLKAALALCYERQADIPSAKLVLAVHDEIVLEVDEAQAEQAKVWLIRNMVDGMTPYCDPVPVEVEAGIQRTWGE